MQDGGHMQCRMGGICSGAHQLVGQGQVGLLGRCVPCRHRHHQACVLVQQALVAGGHFAGARAAI